MNDILTNQLAELSTAQNQFANFVQAGRGSPVILLHGIAASLHDWDELVPFLGSHGFTAFALDLLGHGDSAKPDSRAYHMDWLFEHFSSWIDSLGLNESPVLIGHSLGGYLALQYARRRPKNTRGLILSNPYYRLDQLSHILRLSYKRPLLNSLIVEKTPQWLWQVVIDATSLSFGRSAGKLYQLPEKVRIQTALDYKRTAPGVYNLPNTITDISQFVDALECPTLVIWGDKDLTLNPDSFPALVEVLPHTQGKCIRGAGHVVHQSHAVEFNQLVLEFLYQDNFHVLPGAEFQSQQARQQ